MYLHRYLCDVLGEMRTATETLNFSYLKGLIEEAQTMGNKMEASISNIHDVDDLLERRKRLDKEVKKLRAERDELKGVEEDDRELF